MLNAQERLELHELQVILNEGGGDAAAIARRIDKLQSRSTKNDILRSFPRSARDVNRWLADLGIEERLTRGRGYWYFIEGRSSSWFSSSVPVYRIASGSITWWLMQWALLAGDHRNDLNFSVEIQNGNDLVIVDRTTTNFGKVTFTGDVVQVCRRLNELRRATA